MLEDHIHHALGPSGVPARVALYLRGSFKTAIEWSRQGFRTACLEQWCSTDGLKRLAQGGQGAWGCVLNCGAHHIVGKEGLRFLGCLS